MTFRENIFAKGRCDSVTSFNRAIRFLYSCDTADKKALVATETTADGHAYARRSLQSQFPPRNTMTKLTGKVCRRRRTA